MDSVPTHLDAITSVKGAVAVVEKRSLVELLFELKIPLKCSKVEKGKQYFSFTNGEITSLFTFALVTCRQDLVNRKHTKHKNGEQNNKLLISNRK